MANAKELRKIKNYIQEAPLPEDQENLRVEIQLIEEIIHAAVDRQNQIAKGPLYIFGPPPQPRPREPEPEERCPTCGAIIGR